MFWGWQNSNILNALIIRIRRFINGGIPVSGISVLLAHTAILSRIKRFRRQLDYQSVELAVQRRPERFAPPCRKPQPRRLI